jgi:putative transposase
MDLRFRKLKKPQHGAHIERLMGTLMKEIHALPGTTFSNVDDKGDYDSEGKAVFTLEKFERWLAHLILGRYHNRPHDGLGGVPPVVKYKKALTGEDGGLPVGELSVETNEEQLYYDFLPAFSLTVQPYGMQLDLIKYRSEVLSRWVGAHDFEAPTKARKFVVKRDPRAIGALFFFDPEVKRYFRIPYLNLSNPDISVWELRRVRTYLKAKNQEDVDEETIFNAYNEMRALEMQEVEATKNVRRHSAAKKARSRRDESPQPKFGHAAEGRPEVFATESIHTSDPASTQAKVSQSTSDDAAVPAVSELRDAERASQTSTRPPRKVPRPPPKPFDEIEEY